MTLIQIDGDYGESGGQIVRTALALSTISGKPFEVVDIRKGRAEPGLKNQHLFCIKALEDLCHAKTEGAFLGSTKLSYYPGQIEGKTVSIDIGTSGSISLLLQALLIPSIFSDSKVRLKITGGTDGKWAMPFDYFNNVFLPHIKKYADIEATLIRRGYYPKGGGRVEIKVKPKKEKAKIQLTEEGALIQIKGISHASLDLQKGEVAERQARTARLILNKYNCPVKISSEYSDAFSTGSGITLWGVFAKDSEIDFDNPIIVGADSLGEKGKRAEEVGKEAANKLIEEIESKAPVDSHLADNLIPFLALYGGAMKVSKITNHTLTNIYVCEKFFGRIFEVDKTKNMISTISFINK